MRVKCKACGAAYATVQANGMAYYHRCPPLSVVELQAAIDAGRVTLPDGETAEKAIQHRIYERANMRDENLASTREDNAGQIRAEGAGVEELGDEDPGRVIVG